MTSQTDATFTPGPWKLILHGNETYEYPLSVNTALGSHWITRDGTVSSIANARLIAAAPALYEALLALEASLDLSETHGGKANELWADTWMTLCRNARAALSAARGDGAPS